MELCECIIDGLDIKDKVEFEEVLKLNNDLNQSILYSVIKFVSFLREKGYTIPTSSVISFCQMLNVFDMVDKKQYFLISKSIFCSSKIEYVSYENIFNRFFSFDESEGLGIELNRKIKESKKQMKLIQESLAKDMDKKTLEITNEAIELTKKIINSKFKSITTHKDNVSCLSKDDISEIDSLIKELCESKEDAKFLKSLIVFDRYGIESYLINKNLDFDKIGTMLENMMLLNFSKRNLVNISEVLISSSSALSKIDNESKKNSKVIEDKMIKAKEEFNSSLEELKNKYNNDISKIRMKISTLKHRDEYTEGYNSVIELIDNCDKTISKLSKTEYNYLRYYIRLNASKFRTKLGRSMKRYKNKTFDVKKTVQESVKFNGNPVQYYYKKPIAKKYKLVCMLDISGSVSKHLELLLAFFYEISSVFDGGVEFYGFVSSLIDFTDVFKCGNLEDVVESIKGYRGYSNYGKAIADFYENNYKNIDANTIVLYFGDARNNKNESNKGLLKEINNKAKCSVWLNPEEFSKWNSGDSIIKEYADVTDSVYCVNEVNQLIEFLNDFSVVKNIN